MVQVKTFIFLMLLVCFVSFSFAAPPVTTVQQFPNGYSISVHPITQYFQEGQDLTLHTHVTNSSNGYPINESIMCELHLYTVSSQHKLILKQDTPDDFFDYEFYIKGGNMTKDVKSYHVFCYDGGLGGDYTLAIEVNNTGRGLSISEAILYLGMIFIMVFALFLNFFGMSYLPAYDTKDEAGRILQISYLKYFRLPLWICGYFLVIAICFLSSNLALAYFYEEMFGKILFTIFSVLLALSPVVIILTVIGFFVKFFHDREFQNLLNRGIMPGEL